MDFSSDSLLDGFAPGETDSQEEQLEPELSGPAFIGDAEFSQGLPAESRGTDVSAEIAIEDYGRFMVGSMSIGVLTGAIFMIVGFTVLGIVKIFKRL